MSIFDTLVESGVTQEDLEKAASARLFAEAAAAEGIDLSELTEDQAEELYDFWANGGDDAYAKEASAEYMLQEAAVKEASAKLAEAEYIGRYMARVYADELNKLAAGEEVLLHHRTMGDGGPIAERAKVLEEAALGKNGLIKGKSRKSVVGKAKAETVKPRAAKTQFSAGLQEGAFGRHHTVGSGSESSNALTEVERKVARQQQSRFGGRKATLGERGRVMLDRAVRHIKANPKAYGAGAGAALLGGGYLATRSGEKAASAAIEEMAYLRAEELAATLQTFGEIPDRTYMSDLDEAVDTMAVEMLVDSGWL